MQTSSDFALTGKIKINHILKCFKASHGFMFSTIRVTLLPRLISGKLRLPEAEFLVEKGA
jgi:hypothetical protein